MSPEEIGKKLEESEEIAALHASTSTNANNQTSAPDAEKPLDDHFICLVHKDGENFEVNIFKIFRYYRGFFIYLSKHNFMLLNYYYMCINSTLSSKTSVQQDNWKIWADSQLF